MKGSQGIPSLKLETLNKLISNLPPAPTNFFANMFPATKYDSDTIRWEIEYGSAGMTPFVAPGSIAPAIGLDGIGEASAKAAFFKEKMYFDEEFLNNMREVSTWATYQSAEKKLSRGVKKLDWRIQRRREWMFAQMFIKGSLSYVQKGGTKFTVSYGVPDSHIINLDASRQWDDGASRNPIEDIFDAKRILADDAGVGVEYAMCNSDLLKTLILDSKLQALLSKSTFGNGDLFTNPELVIGTLLGVGKLAIYDEMYEVPGWIMQNVVGGSTTVIHVDDSSDFEVGGKARLYDMSEVNIWEDETISAVDQEAGTITLATAPTRSFKAGEDRVIMKKKFIEDNRFFMFNSSRNGEKIAEFLEAPYGNSRRWGKFSDTKDEWDPEGMWLRVQDKGLPVCYYPDTTITLVVK